MARTIHSDAYKKLISHLVKARQEKGLTQQALAKKLKRPQSFVAKVEYLEMAKAIGIDPLPAFKEAWRKS